MKIYDVVIVGAGPVGLATAIGIGTMVRWVGEIVNQFHEKTTSDTVEVIKNKLNLIKRLRYGFRNFSKFRLRSLLNCDCTIIFL
jgi:transposase